MKNLYKPFLIAVVLLIISLGSLPVSSAPPQSAPQVFTWHTGSMTTTETFGETAWGDGTIYPHQYADIFYQVTQTSVTTDVNPITMTLQVSPNNSDWFDHNTTSSIFAGVITDTSAYTTAAIQGRYYRLVPTLENTNTVTLTLRVNLR